MNNKTDQSYILMKAALSHITQDIKAILGQFQKQLLELEGWVTVRRGKEIKKTTEYHWKKAEWRAGYNGWFSPKAC